MLMQAQARRFAHQLLRSREQGKLIAPLSSDGQLTVADGYDIAKCVLDDRIARGEQPVGRKIGFTNRERWPQFSRRAAITAPIWAMMYDTTVHYLSDNHGVLPLAGMLQPRVEPQIVFGLRAAPARQVDLAGIAECIEWMAPALEVMACPFPDWQFDVVDAVAAFGLHGALLVGERRSLSMQTRHNLAELLVLSSVSLSLSSGDQSGICAAGFGDDVLDSPVHALLQLHALLQAQPRFPPLAAGEIIATGAWTQPQAIRPGEIWSSAYSGVALPGLSVSFT